MAVKCGHCDKKIERYEEYIVCQKSCAGNYHIKCVNIMVQHYTMMTEGGKIEDWSCEACLHQVTLTNNSGANCKQQAVSTDINVQVQDINLFITMKVNEAIQMLTEAISTKSS